MQGWGRIQKKAIQIAAERQEKRAGSYRKSSILRRVKSDKRHKETQSAGVMWVKMLLGTTVVAEDALDVVTGSLALLLTTSLLLKDRK